MTNKELHVWARPGEKLVIHRMGRPDKSVVVPDPSMVARQDTGAVLHGDEHGDGNGCAVGQKRKLPLRKGKAKAKVKMEPKSKNKMGDKEGEQGEERRRLNKANSDLSMIGLGESAKGYDSPGVEVRYP